MDPGVSETAAANDALALLGEPAIVSLNDDNNRARQAKALFAGVRDLCLVEHTWNFAEHEFVPAAESLSPDARGWYRHPLPENCLQVVSVDGADAEAGSWKVVAPANPDAVDAAQLRVLLTRRAAPVVIGTWRIQNAGIWSPGFRSYFAAKLAEALASPLSRDKVDQDRMEEKGERRLRKAKKRDGQEAARQELPRRSSWIDARRGGRRW